GQGVGTTALGHGALVSAPFKLVSWRGIKRSAQRYQRFPLYSTWEGLANTAGLQLTPLFIAAIFGAAPAGIYSLASRVLSMPMSLIGTAVGQVFFANAAEAYRKGQLGMLVGQLHTRLAHIGMPPALVLLIAGPELFAFAFGPEWQLAGEFAQWMAPWLYLV